MVALTDWIGRTEQTECWLDPWRAQALHASIDGRGAPPEAGDALPPCWHWCYFLDITASQQLGPDGHPARGAFLPPVQLPRRMWAGSRLQFFAPLRLGGVARKVSTVQSVVEKSGRAGALCFVTVRHELYAGAELAIAEEQDIVYREPPRDAAIALADAPAAASWRRNWTMDPPRLFRYSALTFNSHRIHYDRDYATQVEGYPGLVVHGPLLATLMLELVRDHWSGRRVSRFEFRAQAPLFDDGTALQICGSPEADAAALWVADAAGGLHMTGRAACD
jgi:3-methylfumaryl-CoA hydratase